MLNFFPVPSWLRTALLCTACIGLNMLCVLFFVATLHIPLFFDTIFTVAAVFYLGLVPALCVSVGYSLLNTLVWMLKGRAFDPLFSSYAVCGIFIVLITWLFARRRAEFRISPVVTALYLVLIATLSSASCIVSGGIIDYFHLTYYDVPDLMNPMKHFTQAFVHQRFSLFAACILAQTPVSFTDRLITTFAGYGAYRLAVRFLGEQGR
ncbi:MAG: hypothetical protein K6G80_07000 [Treponema sp.]|nr:hypothetical protein [Treponema sp.]